MSSVSKQLPLAEGRLGRLDRRRRFMGRRQPRWALVILATTALLVCGATGLAATARTSAVPPQLVGKWTRTITKADTTRAGGLVLAAGKRATFTVPRSGHWTAVIAGLGGLGMADGTVASAGPGQVRFVLTGEPSALYRWHLSGRTLTLTKIRDAVPDRRLFFWGVWKRAV
jgi:hypothetical protein